MRRLFRIGDTVRVCSPYELVVNEEHGMRFVRQEYYFTLDAAALSYIEAFDLDHYDIEHSPVMLIKAIAAKRAA